MGKGSAVISLRARGLSSVKKGGFWDGSTQLLNFLSKLMDMSVSGVNLVTQQTMHLFISGLVCLFSFAFFASFENGGLSQSDNLFLIFNITILLVLVLSVYRSLASRDLALKELKKVTTYVTALNFNVNSHVPIEHREISQRMEKELFKLVEDLHQYLYHKRPYTTEFFAPLKDGVPHPSSLLFKVSREIGIFMQKVNKDLRQLYVVCQSLCKLGLSEIATIEMLQTVNKLHHSVELLFIVKEYRVSGVIKALTFCYVTLVFPIFLAPYFSYISLEVNTWFFPVFFFVLIQGVFVGLLNQTKFLDDPFDDSFLDTISVVEIFDQLHMVLAEEAPHTDTVLQPVSFDAATCVGVNHESEIQLADRATSLNLTSNNVLKDKSHESSSEGPAVLPMPPLSGYNGLV